MPHAREEKRTYAIKARPFDSGMHPEGEGMLGGDMIEFSFAEIPPPGKEKKEKRTAQR